MNSRDADSSFTMMFTIIMVPTLLIVRTWTRSVAGKVRFREGIGVHRMTIYIFCAMLWRIAAVAIPLWLLSVSAGFRSGYNPIPLCVIFSILSVWQLSRRISVGVLQRVEADLPPDPRRDETFLTSESLYHSGRLLPVYHGHGILYRRRRPTFADGIIIGYATLILISTGLALLYPFIRANKNSPVSAKVLQESPRSAQSEQAIRTEQKVRPTLREIMHGRRDSNQSEGDIREEQGATNSRNDGIEKPAATNQLLAELWKEHRDEQITKLRDSGAHTVLGNPQSKVEEQLGKSDESFRDLNGRISQLHHWNGYIVMVRYIDGSAQNAVFAEETDSELSELEINSFLEANAQGNKWERMTTPITADDGTAMRGFVIRGTGSLSFYGRSIINRKPFQHAISVSTSAYVELIKARNAPAK
jgi:hypothetical protein